MHFPSDVALIAAYFVPQACETPAIDVVTRGLHHFNHRKYLILLGDFNKDSEKHPNFVNTLQHDLNLTLANQGQLFRTQWNGRPRLPKCKPCGRH